MPFIPASPLCEWCDARRSAQASNRPYLQSRVVFFQTDPSDNAMNEPVRVVEDKEVGSSSLLEGAAPGPVVAEEEHDDEDMQDEAADVAQYAMAGQSLSLVATASGEEDDLMREESSAAGDSANAERPPRDALKASAAKPRKTWKKPEVSGS